MQPGCNKFNSNLANEHISMLPFVLFCDYSLNLRLWIRFYKSCIQTVKKQVITHLKMEQHYIYPAGDAEIDSMTQTHPASSSECVGLESVLTVPVLRMHSTEGKEEDGSAEEKEKPAG